MSKPKKRRKRRPRVMPPRIPDTPENVARILMTTPPPESWDFLQGQERP